MGAAFTQGIPQHTHSYIPDKTEATVPHDTLLEIASQIWENKLNELSQTFLNKIRGKV